MADINIDSLEPNSHKYKAEKKSAEAEGKSINGKERIPPVVSRSQIVSTKKPLGKKISELFGNEDTKNVKQWLFLDVIIPGIKETILDMLSMMFFGEPNSRGRKKRSDGDRVNYSSYYKGSSDRRSNSRYSRSRKDYYDSDDRVDFRNIILRDRSDAEHVINEMRDRIRKDGSVSVADLLDAIDIPGRYTDNNWGWDDERDIGIRKISNGFLIDVAEPKYLD